MAKFGFMITNLPTEDFPKEQTYPIYSYRVLCIFEKLKVLISRTCLKSKKKGSVSSNEILTVVT